MAEETKRRYDDALLLDAVKEVAQLVDPADLTRVTQRPFDRARQRSKRYSDCPRPHAASPSRWG